MDYNALCKRYFAVTCVPINLIDGEEVLYSSISEILGYIPDKLPDITPTTRNPELCATSPILQFGRVCITGTAMQIVLGPIFSFTVTERIVGAYMREYDIPETYSEILTEYLCSLPNMTYMQFAQHLLLLHSIVNGVEMSIDEFFGVNNNALSESEPQTTQDTTPENDRAADFYRARLLELVRFGQTAKLEKFLAEYSTIMRKQSLAASPLRHAKNAFIVLASDVCAQSVLPSRVDSGRAHQILDMYIRRCELLTSIEAVQSLQYSMLIDFCRQAEKLRLPDGISTEVYRCIHYIQKNIDAGVTVGTVATYIKRSVSSLEKRFRLELGVSVGAYINECRLEEACNLLKNSSLSLADIAVHLCYASQSHFQYVFKRRYHTTPQQYRKCERNELQ